MSVDLLAKILGIVALVFAVMIHEVAHGWVALRCGDPTARDAGRLSLNPVRHIDLVGTIILPTILALSGSGVMFGWAKPVPVNIGRCRNPRQAFWMTAIAGPLSNLLQALLGTALIWVITLATDGTVFLKGEIAINFLVAYVVTNLVLMTFNLVPIPPLDGSKVVAMLLPHRLAIPYLQIGGYGFILIFLLLRTRLVDHLLEGVLVGYMRLVGLAG
ncbi:MAG: site-2 protease family protein [Lentisphaerae bacterium]|nr:site-2 protease family protein [Lentisphaerota bacterium]